ncbi:alpha/beta-hydrolase [Trametes versicolor FP-101664 SS1]|uniref:alpha/beta-hydrolase n=1 Tax=Trametes versicolor (strain FP-101664) TaxID=717944 RepID=UPI0004621AD7|nr:alpha/beta-hydrolase [Trametes versicolor FP-101664 SS1]EIW59808.1 alpha/beta-hydrolase [Trametes versicolor FP-101664 SS1]
MSLCKHCISGVRHEGTPAGQTTQYGGVETYIATPTTEYPKDKAVLFLTDVFGLKLQNNLLLADDYALNGFKVYVPDLFEGDALPEDALNSGTFDIMSWIGKHSPDRVVGIIRGVLAALKADGITKIGAIGFCYGARPAFDLAFNGEVDVVGVSHPSLLKIPDDLEKYLTTSKAPLLINSCTVDSQFPIEAQAKADEILGGGKFAPGYERTYWDGCTHGFAVRGDISDPKVKAGKEGAFKATVEFLIKHL